MSAALYDLANRRSLKAAYIEVEQAIEDIRRITKQRQARIDALVASIERDARQDVRAHDLCPSDTEPSVA